MQPTVDEGPSRPPGSADEAPVVVLLHGQPGSAGEWFRVVGPLCTDHRVIAVDRPGYAGDPTAVTNWSGNATALLALLDRLGLSRVTLVAASWAGGIALELAARAPERFTGMVLLGPVGGRGSITFFDRLLTFGLIQRAGISVVQRLGRRGNRALARLIAITSGSRLDRQAQTAAAIAAALWQLRGAWVAACVEQVYLVHDAQRLHRLVARAADRVPIVILTGRHDRYVPTDACRDLSERLSAQLVELDAGHLINVETPDAVVEAVRSLTRPRSRSASFVR